MKRIAVVGGGLAGLSAAWLLSQNENNFVTLYESQSSVGLGAFSVDYVIDRPKSGSGEKKTVRVDVPTRVFSEKYYPQLLQLYRYNGISTQPASHAATFCFMDGSNYFRFGNFQLGRFSLPYVSLTSLLNWSTLRLCYDMLHFARQSKNTQVMKEQLSKLTLRQFLKENNYSQTFIDAFLLPTLSVICTCDYQSVMDFPAEVILEYYGRIALQGRTMHRATGGTEEVIKCLSSKISKVECNSNLLRLRVKENSKLQLEFEGKSEEFDHCILGLPANKAAEVLAHSGVDKSSSTPFIKHISTLSQFKYEASDMVLHRDTALMPSREEEWSNANIFIDGSPLRERRPMATMWMNKIQPELIEEDPVFQTWNPSPSINTKAVLSKAVFYRPVVTMKSKQLIEELADLQGNHNIWFCGAYSVYGVPLLELAVQSGLTVAERIGGIQRPWTTATADSSSEGKVSPSCLSHSHNKSLLNISIVVLGVAVAFLSYTLCCLFP